VVTPKSLFFVKDTLLLVDLGPDWDGRVDGVGDDANHGLWAVLGASDSEVTDDRGVGVKEIVSGHTGLSGDTSGNDNNLSTGQSALDVGALVALDIRVSVDVANVCCDTGCTSDVVQREGSHERVSLEQQRHRLANTAGSTEDCDFALSSR